MKAFGTFVLTFGIAVSLLGGGIVLVNQPLSPGDMDSERAHSEGIKILIAGVIASFVGIVTKVASPKKPAPGLQATNLSVRQRMPDVVTQRMPDVVTQRMPDAVTQRMPDTNTQGMPAVEPERQTQDTSSQPLQRCPKCGAPSYDLRNHRCRASVPDRSY